MFIMMNAARFAVGMEGVAVAEAAYQKALAYAKERLQSRELGGSGSKAVPIIRHPDVRRMLMSMKAQAEATRALAYVVAGALDKAHRHPDKDERARAQAFVDLMIPIVKGWSTETSIDVASLGIQVHGGMGFIEETGAAQHLRDARITTIYEGTTGIQAADLIGRKIARDGGQAVRRVIEEMRAVGAELERESSETLSAVAARLRDGVSALEQAVQFILSTYAADVRKASVGAVPFLELFGTVAGGWQTARAALVAHRRIAAGEGESGFLRAKLGTARFYADHVLVRAAGLARTVVTGAEGALALEDDQL
jgi:acyl-CoA dehydrogenase